MDALRQTLWEILLDMDDLSSATASVMQLLWQLYSQPGSFQPNKVRLAVVQCCKQLVGACPKDDPWLLPLVTDVLILTFTNLLLESHNGVLDSSQRVWELLMRHLPGTSLTASLPPAVIGIFFRLASTPVGHSYDEGLVRQLLNHFNTQDPQEAEEDNACNAP